MTAEEKEKFLEQIRMLGASQEAVEKVKNTYLRKNNIQILNIHGLMETEHLIVL